MSFRRYAALTILTLAAVAALTGCGKSSSTTAPTTLAATPPAAPTNLSGLYNASTQKDYLIWTASTSPGVANYEVWQYSGDPAAGNSGSLVGTVASSLSFLALPTPTQNLTFYYRMRSLDASSTPSAFSATVSIQRHGAVAVTDPGTGDPSGDPVTPGVH